MNNSKPFKTSVLTCFLFACILLCAAATRIPQIDGETWQKIVNLLGGYVTTNSATSSYLRKDIADTQTGGLTFNDRSLFIGAVTNYGPLVSTNTITSTTQGSALSPSFAISSSNGIYKSGTGALDFSLNGIQRFQISAGALTLLSGTYIVNSSGASNGPAYEIIAGSGTGMYRNGGENSLSLSSGAFEAVRCRTNGEVTLFKNLTVSNNLTVASNITGNGTDNTMPSQTLTGSGSVLNQGLADARYVKLAQTTGVFFSSNGLSQSYQTRSISNSMVEVYEGYASVRAYASVLLASPPNSYWTYSAEGQDAFFGGRAVIATTFNIQNNPDFSRVVVRWEYSYFFNTNLAITNGDSVKLLPSGSTFICDATTATNSVALRRVIESALPSTNDTSYVIGVVTNTATYISNSVNIIPSTPVVWKHSQGFEGANWNSTIRSFTYKISIQK